MKTRKEQQRDYATCKRRERGVPLLKLRDRTHCRHGHPLTEDNIYIATPTDRQGLKRMCAACQRASAKKWRYGISPKQYKDLILSQGGYCKICTKLMKPACIDHDHVTGRIRGLLCTQCNTLLAMAGDKKNILVSAIDYLAISQVT